MSFEVRGLSLDDRPRGLVPALSSLRFSAACRGHRARADRLQPRLHVIVQKRLVREGKAKAMMAQFVDYKPSEWKEMPLGDFVCFYIVD